MHKRQSGIELLRLFVMFGIVLSHWGGHGSWVFLISENPNIYPRFWTRLFDNMQYYDSPYMIGVALIQCAIVFLSCIIIDKLYKGTLALIGL